MARRDDICEHLDPIMLTYYRRKKYKTRKTFAKRVGKSVSAVDSWENGEKTPTWKSVIKAAEVLNIHPRQLIKRSKRHIIDDFLFHLLEFLKSPPEVKKVTKIETITETGKESLTKTEGKLKLTAREAIDLADKLGYFPKTTFEVPNFQKLEQFMAAEYTQSEIEAIRSAILEAEARRQSEVEYDENALFSQQDESEAGTSPADETQ